MISIFFLKLLTLRRWESQMWSGLSLNFNLLSEAINFTTDNTDDKDNLDTKISIFFLKLLTLRHIGELVKRKV